MELINVSSNFPITRMAHVVPPYKATNVGSISLDRYGYRFDLPILPVPGQFFPYDHPSWTSVHDPPASDAGRFDFILLELYSDHNNNGGKQQTHSPVAVFPSHLLKA